MIERGRRGGGRLLAFSFTSKEFNECLKLFLLKHVDSEEFEHRKFTSVPAFNGKAEKLLF